VRVVERQQASLQPDATPNTATPLTAIDPTAVAAPTTTQAITPKPGRGGLDAASGGTTADSSATTVPPTTVAPTTTGVATTTTMVPFGRSTKAMPIP